VVALLNTDNWDLAHLCLVLRVQVAELLVFVLELDLLQDAVLPDVQVQLLLAGKLLVQERWRGAFVPVLPVALVPDLVLAVVALELADLAVALLLSPVLIALPAVLALAVVALVLPVLELADLAVARLNLASSVCSL